MTEELLNTTAVDFDAMNESELENLSLDGLLGVNVADIRLSNSLPGGTYLFEPIKIEKTVKAADIGADKRARVMIIITNRVVKCLALDDGSLTPADYDGKTHVARFNWATERGRRELTLWALLILGIDPRQKAQVEALGRDLGPIVNEIVGEKIVYGGVMNYSESNGFENTNFNYRADKFLSAGQALELMD